MNFLRSVTAISFFTILSRITGFFRTIIMANFVGAGAMADALIIAIKFPSVMRRIFAEGAFNSAFVPTFSGMLASGNKQQAKSYAENILAILVLTLSVLIILVELFMPSILKVIIPGFINTPDRMHYAIEFTRITFPFILFISICALFSGILNSMEKFSCAASSPMVGSLVIIAVFFLIKGHMISHAKAFAVCIAIGGLAQSLWVFIPVLRSGMQVKICWPTITPETKKFFKLIVPVAAGAGVVQLNIFIDMMIASFLDSGGISYLEYADRLNQLPLSTIGVAMGTALLPILSKQIRKKDYLQAIETQNMAVQYGLVFVIPAMLGLFIFSGPIVQAIYLHGKLSIADIKQIAMTLQAFAAGLPAYILIKIFNSAFFANEDTKTPVKVALCSMVINVIMNLWLMRYWHHVGIALSTAISAWINYLLLKYYLVKDFNFRFVASFQQFLFKLGVVNLLLALVMIMIKYYVWEWLILSIHPTVAILLIILAAKLIYIALAIYAKIVNSKDINLYEI